MAQDGSSTQAGVKEGDLLAGKYRIDKVLGVGGMGVVVAAHHIHLDERVAIKFLLREALGNQEAVARFAREARAAVKIKSEHVVRVSDVGTLETGAPYMVMEYLEGEDLSAWLHKRGPLPVEQAVDFLLQACEAIAEAHALGIVHRDLKPANLFVGRQPDGRMSVKVLDFGISKVKSLGSSGPDLGMTKTTAVMGSPLYMSPEQMQSSKDVDPRADIWALGVILYELLTGVTSFEADTMPELIVKILQAPPIPLRNKRPDAPPGIERVIHRCLEKDRAKRYTTVGEFGHDLVEFGSRRARASLERISGVLQSAGMSASGLDLPPPSSVGPQAAESPAGGTMAAWGQTHATLTGRRAILGGIAAAAVALVVLGVLLGRRSSDSSDTAKTPVPAAPAAPPAAVAPPPHEEPAAPAIPPPVPSAPVGEALPAAHAVLPTPLPPHATAPTVKIAVKTPAKKAEAKPAAPASPAPAAKAAPVAAPRSNAFDDRK